MKIDEVKKQEQELNEEELDNVAGGTSRKIEAGLFQE
jgi:bacteriocin-like protein